MDKLPLIPANKKQLLVWRCSNLLRSRCTVSVWRSQNRVMHRAQQQFVKVVNRIKRICRWTFKVHATFVCVEYAYAKRQKLHTNLTCLNHPIRLRSAFSFRCRKIATADRKRDFYRCFKIIIHLLVYPQKPLY